MRRILTALLLVFTLVPAAPALAAGPVEAPQGSWVGTHGADGFVLASWDVGTDLVALPTGVSVALTQGIRHQWDGDTVDVRALESADESTRRAAVWFHGTEVQAGLTFTDAYSGTIRLYSVDWDTTTRRQTVTVSTTTNGSQSTVIDADFSGGAWVDFAIDVLAAETVTIAVTDNGPTNAVLSGIFLGGASAGAPSGVGTVAGNGEVDVSWTAPSTTGGSALASYNVYRSETSGGPYDTPVSVPDTPTTYNDTGLVNGTTYYYVVRAVNATVEGPASDEVSATPVAPPGAWVEAPQGSWVGTHGADGFVLASWDVGTDLVALPTGVSVSLDQGSRLRWEADTVDVRALESADESTRRAAVWYHGTEVQAGLTFTDAYSGTIRLYSVDWDTTVRRQTVTVSTTTNGSQSTVIAADFSGGAWVDFAIDVLAAETVTIAVTDNGPTNAVLSGIFLGGPTPGAPLAVGAVAGDGEVDVSWTAPSTTGGSALASYNVYRSETSGGPYDTPVSVPDTPTTYNDTGLVNGTTYYYVVRAVNATVEGPASDEVSATPVAPGAWVEAPQGSWVGTHGADGFVLASWDVGTDLVALPTGVSVALTQGSRFRWEADTVDVRALESADESTRRAAVWYHGTEVQASLTFTDAYSGTIRLYSVDWDTTVRRQTVTVSTTTNGSQSTVIDADFSGGAWVDFAIDVLAAETVTIAVTDNGSPNAVLSGIFLGGASAGAPSGVGTVAGNGEVDVSWTAPSTTGGSALASYNVYRSETSGGPYDTPVSVPDTPTTYNDTGLVNGTTYYYVVRAVNATVEGPASDEVSATPVAPPGAWVEAPQGSWVGTHGADGFVLASWDVGTDLVALPTGVSVSLDQGSRFRWEADTVDVRALESADESTRRAAVWYHGTEVQAGLTFTDAYSGTIRLYSVDWDTTVRRQTVTVSTTTNGSQSTVIAADFSGGAWVDFAIDVLAAETVSIAVTDNGPTNAVLSGIFLGGASAGAPLAVGAVAGDGEVDVSWTAPSTTGGSALASYNVYRSETSGGPYDTPVSVPDTPTTYNDTGLVNGTTYYYVVRAVNATVEGPASDEVSATPVAPPGAWVEAPQGSWVGTHGADGFVLASWDVGTDLVALPTGVSVSLDQGSRFRWEADTVDVRALESADESTRRAAVWYHGTEVQAGLTFTDAYSGTIRLYSVDWDTTVRRQTVTVSTTTNGSQSTVIAADFSGGAWVDFAIDVLAAETVTIAVTDNGPTNAVLSGIFLGGPTPGAPLAVGAVAGDGEVDVSWTAPSTTGGSALASYNVYRSETSGGPYDTPVSVPDTPTTYNDTGLVNGTTYYYVVRAVNATVEGPASDEVSATPVAPGAWVEAPQGSWVGTHGADGFVLASWDVGTDLVALPTGVSVALTQGSRFRWEADTVDVRALESADESTRRAAVWYHGTEVQASLTFTDAYSGTIRLYSVDWDTTVRRQTVTVSTTTNGSQSTVIDADFSGGAWVDFAIDVLAAETVTIAVTDNGSPNAVLSGIFLGGASAGAPSGVGTVAGNGEVDVSWTAPTTTGGSALEGYWVYRSETSGGPYGFKASEVTTSYNDTGVVNGTTYYYVVRAVNATVEGPASDEVSATPVAPPGAWVEAPQGSWVGTHGADGFVLASWDVGTDLVALPTGVSVSLDQGSRFRWEADTVDVRALESADESTRRAATWFHGTEVQAGLTFTDAYSGTIRLYSVDWDTTVRRQTVTVSTTTNGSQSTVIDADFSGGAWVDFAIDVLAAETVSIAVTDNGPTNAVLSGIFLGGPAVALVSVGADGTVLTSPNGVTWNSQTSGITSQLLAAASDGSQWAAVGFTGTILTSPDGATWTSQTSGTPVTLVDVGWDGSQWVAVGATGTILTSSDGVTWTSQTSGTTVLLRRVAWDGSQWVAVGDTGTILTSPDGVTWTSQTSGTTSALIGVAWGGSQWAAVGATGTILTSPDGVTWTSQTSGTTVVLYGVAWDGSQWAAVGDTGTILTSPDGVTWTSQTSGTTVLLPEAAWDGSQWAAVGHNGTVLTSPDGVTWTSQTSGTTSNLLGVASG